MANSAPKCMFTGKCMENVWKITVILRFLLSIFHTTSDWHEAYRWLSPFKPNSKADFARDSGTNYRIDRPKMQTHQNWSKSGKNWSLRWKNCPRRKRALVGILRNWVRNWARNYCGQIPLMLLTLVYVLRNLAYFCTKFLLCVESKKVIRNCYGTFSIGNL